MSLVYARMLRIAVVALALLAVPRMVRAIPVFANGQNVSCTLCHTSFPGMKPYGMMTMMMNMQNLQEHLQTGTLPVALHAEIDTYLANQGNRAQTSVSTLSLLGGGFIGRNMTWYAEQPFVDSGEPGVTEQLWVSWNGLLHGTNSLQVGKFHTPFPFMPAHGFTIGSYLLATQTNGQNDFAPNDAHWGVAFNGMSNEFMYNLSWLAGDVGTGQALDYDRAGAPRTLDANLAYGGMDLPYTIGLVAMRGSAPLRDAGGAYAGSEAFTREGLYYAYQRPTFQIQTMYYHGYDAQLDLGTPGGALNGWFFEIERDYGWRNHIVARYDVAASDSLNRRITLDFVHHVAPNLKITGEMAMAPGTLPVFGVRLGWAGPWLPGRRYTFNPTQGVHVTPIAARQGG
ncbi:hypothetical protein EPN42_12445 [bacterium]|nr:MAG: hypothetical protein EPN42_12445 [bacterium]